MTFDPTKIKKIGVYTSGGDAPGMNAALRATVRAAIQKNLKVEGIRHAYAGMIKGDILPLNRRSMANIIQRGGTILKSGRCKEFMQPEGRALAAAQLKKNNIDALICIGGDGSFRGAQALWQEHQIPVVGLPGTIDNDVWGTDLTIGFDTAVNTAMEAIDKIRDTAASHDRLFIVEVMGRDSGFIALEVGLSGGAEEIFVPENPVNVDEVIKRVEQAAKNGKDSSILVAAEGQEPGRAYTIAEAFRKKAGIDAKVCILGHIQRGGSPTATDRNLASRLGAASVDVLLKGSSHHMVGILNNEINVVELSDTFTKKKPLNKSLIDLAGVLSL